VIYLLAGLLVVTIAWHMWSEQRHATERKRLVDAVVARHGADLAILDPAQPKPLPKRKKDAGDSATPVRQWGA
jgi:hypothetical protein